MSKIDQIRKKYSQTGRNPSISAKITIQAIFFLENIAIINTNFIIVISIIALIIKILFWYFTKDISTNINYPYPIHKMKAYSYMTKDKNSHLPITVKMSKGIFSLPIYPEFINMIDDNLKDYVDVVTDDRNYVKEKYWK